MPRILTEFEGFTLQVHLDKVEESGLVDGDALAWLRELVEQESRMRLFLKNWSPGADRRRPNAIPIFDRHGLLDSHPGLRRALVAWVVDAGLKLPGLSLRVRQGDEGGYSYFHPGFIELTISHHEAEGERSYHHRELINPEMMRVAGYLERILPLTLDRIQDSMVRDMAEKGYRPLPREARLVTGIGMNSDVRTFASAEGA